MNKIVLFWKDAKTAFSIFIKNLRNGILKYKHFMASHVSSTSTFTRITESFVLISLNVMWNIRNEADKIFAGTK